MAEILSTLSSDGKGTPTNGGAHYATMSAWESAQQTLNGDLVAGGNTAVLECYNDWTGQGLADITTIDGWTTAQANNITVRAAAGQGQTG
jgi:hypothetical protein